MNIYGPRMDDSGTYVSVIMKVLDRIDEGLPPLIYGDGTQTYDFVHVEDVARANILALKTDATDSSSTSAQASVRRSASSWTMLLEITGSDHRAGVPPQEQIFVTHRVGSTEHAERLLGFPRGDRLREGLSRWSRGGAPTAPPPSSVCGIAGVLERSRRPVDPKVLQRMGDVIAHRGPDGEGVFVGRPVGLGQPPPGDHRPVSGGGDADGVTGRPLLDHLQRRGLQLRRAARELAAAGHTFRSHTDTEVVLNAYTEWGPACVERFNGMFAFAIWDRERSSCSSPAIASASSRSTTRTSTARSCSAQRSSRCSSTRRSRRV